MVYDPVSALLIERITTIDVNLKVPCGECLDMAEGALYHHHWDHQLGFSVERQAVESLRSTRSMGEL